MDTWEPIMCALLLPTLAKYLCIALELLLIKVNIDLYVSYEMSYFMSFEYKSIDKSTFFQVDLFVDVYTFPFKDILLNMYFFFIFFLLLLIFIKYLRYVLQIRP